MEAIHLTHSAVSYLYNFGIKRMRVGFGSAIGVSLFVICVVVMVFYKRIFMRPKEGRKAMENNRSGPFVYYRWLILLLASGLCLLPLWATVIGGFKSPGDLRTNAFGCLSNGCLTLRSIVTSFPLLADAG